MSLTIQAYRADRNRTPHSPALNRPGMQRKYDYNAVVQALADGGTFSEVGKKFDTTGKTIQSILYWLKKRYELRNTTHVVAHFLRNGWID